MIYYAHPAIIAVRVGKLYRRRAGIHCSAVVVVIWVSGLVLLKRMRLCFFCVCVLGVGMMKPRLRAFVDVGFGVSLLWCLVLCGVGDVFFAAVCNQGSFGGVCVCVCVFMCTLSLSTYCSPPVRSYKTTLFFLQMHIFSKKPKRPKLREHSATNYIATKRNTNAGASAGTGIEVEG